MTSRETKGLDKRWSKLIHERDKFCLLCGIDRNLNAHHVVGRRAQTLRWDLDNGLLLCSGCHTFRTRSAHQNGRWFHEWFTKQYPTRNERLKELEWPPQKQDYENISNYLKQKEEEYGLL